MLFQLKRYLLLKPHKVKSRDKRLNILKFILSQNREQKMSDYAEYLESCDYDWINYHGLKVKIFAKSGRPIQDIDIISKDMIEKIKNVRNMLGMKEILINSRKQKIEIMSFILENLRCNDNLSYYLEKNYRWYLLNGDHLFILNKEFRCVYYKSILDLYDGSSKKKEEPLYPNIDILK